MADESGKVFVQAPQALMQGEERQSQAEILVDLVMSEKVRLFHTPEYEAYAEIALESHRECWGLNSKSFKRWMLRIFYNVTGKVCGNHALNDALHTLEGFATYEGESGSCTYAWPNMRTQFIWICATTSGASFASPHRDGTSSTGRRFPSGGRGECSPFHLQLEGGPSTHYGPCLEHHERHQLDLNHGVADGSASAARAVSDAGPAWGTRHE